MVSLRDESRFMPGGHTIIQHFAFYILHYFFYHTLKPQQLQHLSVFTNYLSTLNKLFTPISSFAV